MSKPIFNNVFDGPLMFIIKPLVGLSILFLFGIKNFMELSSQKGILSALLEAVKSGMLNLASKASIALKYIFDYKNISQMPVNKFSVYLFGFLLSFLTLYLIISPIFDIIMQKSHFLIKLLLFFALYVIIAVLILVMFKVQIGENISNEISPIVVMNNSQLPIINQSINQTIDIDLMNNNITTNTTGGY